MRNRCRRAIWLGLLAAAAPAWAELLPADRTTAWRPGVPGGIPRRTAVCATLKAAAHGDGAQSASEAIQAALDTCPAGQVVQLSAGRFSITSHLLVHSAITLRGAGPGATVLVKKDGARARAAPMKPIPPNTYTYDAQPIVILGPQRWVKPDPATSQPLAADGAKGGRSVTVASGRGFLPGSFVLLDERSGASWQPTPRGFPGNAKVWQGDRVAWNMHLPVQKYQDDSRAANADGPYDTAPGVQPPAMAWFSRPDRPIAEIKEIASVSGNTITFTTPLHIGYRTSHAAELTRYDDANAHVKGAGVEDLTVRGGADGQIRFENAALSWARNVESTQWIGEGFAVDGSFRVEIRDSYVHDGSWPEPGGAGYAISLASGSSEVLVENNIIVDACKNMVARSSGAGSVFGYNHVDDSWDFDTPGWVEVGLNASHMAGPHHVLFEGNYAPNLDSDYTHGNAIHLTFFRNWLSGQRRSFTDTTNLRAVGLAYGSWWDSIVGNVLGRPGKMGGWLYDAPAMSGDSAAWKDKTIWKLGYDPERWGMFADPKVLSTVIRGGNFDYLTNEVHWEGLPQQQLPRSLYLQGKPAFFGSLEWPWVDPTGAVKLRKLPATERYERMLAAAAGAGVGGSTGPR